MAADGVQALRLLASDCYDILLSDVHMLGLDGWTLARGVRAMRPDVGVVLMSAEFFDDASPGGGQQRMHADMVRLAKPFSIGELLTAMEQSIKPSLVERNGRTACHLTPRGTWR